jgi:hypothetical protein
MSLSLISESLISSFSSSFSEGLIEGASPGRAGSLSLSREGSRDAVFPVVAVSAG